MPQQPDDDPRPIAENVHLEGEAKAVIADLIEQLHAGLIEQLHAGRIEHLDLHFEAPAAFTPLDPFVLPPLPGNFIERPEFTEPLVESLLSSDSAVGLTAVEGMPGVGKSVTALSLCYHPRIREAFPDGIVWLTLGRQSTFSLAQQVEKVATAFNQQFRSYTAETYISLLRNRAALIVLDDVWTLEAVEPFLPPPGRSRLIYTSRNRDLAGRLGAESLEIGVLDAEQGRRFLLRWSGRERKPPPEAFLHDILAECKGLVLALAMIGGRLRGQDDREWSLVLTDLRHARLEQVGVRPGGYAHETLHASIGISVEALDAATRQAYLQLAVLLEDMPAPEPLLQALWGGDGDNVHRLGRKLVDRSLASRDAEGSLRLHDLQLDYLCAEYPDAGALRVIHATVRRSLHVLQFHPEQFSSQMIGRLLPFADSPPIAAFVEHLDTYAPLPRLRPIRPGLQPAGDSERVLEGHNGGIFALALSEEGRWATSCSNDHTIQVWDLDGHTPPRVLKGQIGADSMALSEDGRWAVYGMRNNLIRVWDVAGSWPPRTLKGHTRDIHAVAISGDGRRVISSSVDGTVRLWDLEGDVPPRILHDQKTVPEESGDDGRTNVVPSAGHLTSQGGSATLTDSHGLVAAVALSRDGKRAVAGMVGGTLHVWDLEKGAPPRILEGHTDAIHAVALSADGLRTVSGAADNTVRVWDLENKQSPRILKGHEDNITVVGLSQDGSRVVSGSDDSTVRVWNLDSNAPPRVLEGHGRRIYSISMSANGRRVVTGAEDWTLRVWDLESHATPQTWGRHKRAVTAVALSADGKKVVSGSDDRIVRVWDIETGAPPLALHGHEDSVSAVALSGDGKTAISGSEDRTVRIWDLAAGTSLFVLGGHLEAISAVALSADGRRAASASSDKTVRVWDGMSGEPLVVLEAPADMGEAPAVSNDGWRVASASKEKMARVWDLMMNGDPESMLGARSNPLAVLNAPEDTVKALALSADGLRVGAASQEGNVCVWNLDGNTPPLRCHAGNFANAFALWSALAARDFTFSEADLEAMAPVRTAKLENGPGSSLALSENGKRAVSVSHPELLMGDKFFHVWDFESRKRLADFTGDAPFTCCSWASGLIAVGDENGQLHLLRWEE